METSLLMPDAGKLSKRRAREKFLHELLVVGLGICVNINIGVTYINIVSYPDDCKEFSFVWNDETGRVIFW